MHLQIYRGSNWDLLMTVIDEAFQLMNSSHMLGFISRQLSGHGCVVRSDFRNLVISFRSTCVAFV